MPRVELVEVGPRDGFQSVGPFIPTATKLDFVRGLAAAGFRRIEIGSFVSPKAVPQMADTEALLAATRSIDGLHASVLVPNLRGAQRAAAAGATEIVYVCSATESHNQANVRRSVRQSLDEFAEVAREVAAPHRIRVRLDLSMAFDCPFEGRVKEEAVLAMIASAIESLESFEIALCDTTGRAAPDHVARLFGMAMKQVGDRPVSWAFHGHDTYGLGIANVAAAYGAGVRVFDGSMAGLGGCPFAPGATGNVASEDMAYLFQRMAVTTGIDLAALLAVGDRAAGLPGACIGGRVRAVPRARAVA